MRTRFGVGRTGYAPTGGRPVSNHPVAQWTQPGVALPPRGRLEWTGTLGALSVVAMTGRHYRTW